MNETTAKRVAIYLSRRGISPEGILCILLHAQVMVNVLSMNTELGKLLLEKISIYISCSLHYDHGMHPDQVFNVLLEDDVEDFMGKVSLVMRDLMETGTKPGTPLIPLITITEEKLFELIPLSQRIEMDSFVCKALRGEN